MKTSILALGLVLSFNTFAAEAGIPNLNCVGNVDGVYSPLMYRDGGAAFMNVYAGEIKDIGFMVVLNKANPVQDSELLPVTMIIGNNKLGKTYVEKNAVMAVDANALKITAKSEDGKQVALVCSRLLTK